MDELKKLELIRKIRKVQGHAPRPKEILISLEDFFDGNDEAPCGLLANTRVHLSAPQVAEHLRQVRSRADVSGCFIRFYDYDDALDFADAWVNSDTVYVVSSAGVDEIASWFAPLEPSDVRVEQDVEAFANAPTIPAGHAMVAVWWD